MSRRGYCQVCGDEWVERDAPAICPECHSLDVEELPQTCWGCGAELTKPDSAPRALCAACACIHGAMP